MKYQRLRTNIAALPVDHRSKTSSWISTVSWVVVYLVVVALASAGSPDLLSLTTPAIVALGFAFWGFYRQGGPSMNASSLYCYCNGVFAAFAALYAGINGGDRAEVLGFSSLVTGLTVLVVAQGSVMLLSPSRARGTNKGRGSVVKSTVRPYVAASILLAMAIVVRDIPGIADFRVAQGACTLAILLFVVGAAYSRSRTNLVLNLIAASVAGAAYYLLLFEGFGRLVLGAIACGALAVITAVRRSYIPKTLLTVLTGPAVIVLAAQRLSYLEEARRMSVGEDEGIGSVVGPFLSFCKILQAAFDGRIGPSGLQTTWAAVTSWIPRSWWSEKPLGFGFEMVYITQPARVGVAGFSDAALLMGEVVWSSGVVLLPLGVLVMGLVVRAADTLICRLTPSDEGLTWRGAWQLLLIGVIAACSVSLFWGGTFTAVTRSLTLIVVCSLAIIFTSPPDRADDARPIEEAVSPPTLHSGAAGSK